jgi:lysophospholipase L1-like esterase
MPNMALLCRGALRVFCYCSTLMPGAILLMAGTNDVKQGVPQATIIANLTRMIDI